MSVAGQTQSRRLTVQAGLDGPVAAIANLWTFCLIGHDTAATKSDITGVFVEGTERRRLPYPVSERRIANQGRDRLLSLCIAAKAKSGLERSFGVRTLIDAPVAAEPLGCVRCIGAQPALDVPITDADEGVERYRIRQRVALLRPNLLPVATIGVGDNDEDVGVNQACLCARAFVVPTPPLSAPERQLVQRRTGTPSVAQSVEYRAVGAPLNYVRHLHCSRPRKCASPRSNSLSTSSNRFGSGLAISECVSADLATNTESRR